MSGRRIDMHRLQEAIRLHRLGRSGRAISNQVRIGRNTLRAYLAAVETAGLLEGDPDELPEVDALRAVVSEHVPSSDPPQQKSSVESWRTQIVALWSKDIRPKAIHDYLRLHEPEYAGSLSAIKRMCARLDRSRRAGLASRGRRGGARVSAYEGGSSSGSSPSSPRSRPRRCRSSKNPASSSNSADLARLALGVRRVAASGRPSGGRASVVQAGPPGALMARDWVSRPPARSGNRREGATRDVRCLPRSRLNVRRVPKRHHGRPAILPHACSQHIQGGGGYRSWLWSKLTVRNLHRNSL